MNTPGSSRYTSPTLPHVPPPTAPAIKQTSPRKTHRRRVSAVRLSSDTTSTLPEYNPLQLPLSSTTLISPDHQRQQQGGMRGIWEGQRMGVEEGEADLPPRYEEEDSAEEADEDTDDEGRGGGVGYNGAGLRRDVGYSLPAMRSTPTLMSPVSSGGPMYPSTQGYTYPHPSRTRRGPGVEGMGRQQQQQQHRQHRSMGSRDSLLSSNSNSSSRSQHRSRASRSHHAHHPSHASYFSGNDSRGGLYRQDESAEEEDDDPTISLRGEDDRDKDDYLDSLLQRSVQALEMSNVLMQTSISTRDSVDAMVRGEGSPRNASPGPGPSSTRHSPAGPYNQLSSSSHSSPRNRYPKLGHHRPHRSNPSYDLRRHEDYSYEGRREHQDARRYGNRRWNREMNDIYEESGDDMRDAFGRVPSAGSPVDVRMRRTPVWEDDLDEIKRTLDAWALDGEGYQHHPSARPSRSSSGHVQESSLSSSLPVESSMPARQSAHLHQRPSLDPSAAASITSSGVAQIDEVSPQLRLSFKGRDQLVAPPPRALTQYISTDPDEIVLPSTLGLRAGSHSWKAASTTTLNVQTTGLPQSSDPSQFHSAITSTFANPTASSHAANSSAAYSVLSSIASPLLNSSNTPNTTTSSSFLSPLTSPRLSVATFTRPFRRRASTGMKDTQPGLDRHPSPGDPTSSHSHLHSQQQACSSSTNVASSPSPALVRSSRISATHASRTPTGSDSPSRSPSYSRSHSRNAKNLTINTLPHLASSSSSSSSHSHSHHTTLVESTTSSGQHTTQTQSPVASLNEGRILSLASSSGNSSTTTLTLPSGSRSVIVPPPIQETLSPSPPPSEPSSESDSYPAKLTIKCLRKILEDQEIAASAAASSLDLTAGGKNSNKSHKLKPPQFMPSGGPDGKKSGTSGVSEPRISTATASVSRLLTKGTHSSSTRPPDPPRVSVLKKATPTGSPGPATPNAFTDSELSGAGHSQSHLHPHSAQSQSTLSPQPSLPTLNLPTLRLPSFSGPNSGSTSSLGSLAQGTGYSIFVTTPNASSTPASGTSTPKRISFAEPLEGTLTSSASSSSRFKARKQASSSSSSARRKRRSSSLGSSTGSGSGSGSGAGAMRRRTEEEELIDGMPWWTRWLFSAAAVGGVQSQSGPVGAGIGGGGGGGGSGFHSGHGADERGGAMRWGGAGRVDDWGY